MFYLVVLNGVLDISTMTTMRTLLGYTTMTHMMTQNWGERAIETAANLKGTVELLVTFLQEYWSKIEEADTAAQITEDARTMIGKKKFAMLLRLGQLFCVGV